MKNTLKHLLALVLCILLTAGTMLPAVNAVTAGEAANADKTAQEPKTAALPYVDIIQLTDMHGRIGTSANPIAGRMAVLIESVRKRNRSTTLLLDGGDIYTDSTNFDLGTAHEWAMRRWIDYVGFDVEVVGNHEFDRDFNNVQDYMANSSAELICCNIFHNDGTLVGEKGSVIIEKNGIRLLIVGSMAEMPFKMTGLDIVGDPVACTKQEIDRYSRDEYDIILPIIHGDGAPLISLAKLADEGYPVACVFGGHSHDTVVRDYYTPGGRHVPAYVANPYNEGLAYLRLYYNPQTKEVSISEASAENNILTLPATNPSPDDEYYDVFAGALQIIKDWENETQTPAGRTSAKTRTAVKLPENPAPKADTAGGCGANLTWSLDTGTGVLTISGSGEMDSFSVDKPAPWGIYKSRITALVLPSGLTNIGCNAFSDFTGLTNLTIPDSVTKIEPWAFFGCNKLETLQLSRNVKSLGRYAFYGCSKLSSISLPEGIAAVGECAFRCCTALTEFALADSATEIGYGLVKDTPFYSNAAWEDEALYFGKHLIEVRDTQRAVTIKSGTVSIADSAFAERESITGVTIPDSVRRIGEWAFFNCSALKSVNIPDSVTDIGEFAFSYCDALSSLTIGSGVRSIGFDAFRFCPQLSQTGAFHIKDMASWCAIRFASYNSNPLYYARKLYLNDSLVTDLVIPDGVTGISPYAFYLCDGLKSVKLPDTVSAIGKAAFFNCSNMTEINIPEGVETIEEAVFNSCYSLGGILLPRTLSSVGKNAFNNCSRLRYIIFLGEPPAIDSTSFETAASQTPAGVYYYPTQAWKSFGMESFGSNLIWIPLEGQLTAALRYAIDPELARITISGADNMPSISSFKPWIWEALKDFVRDISFDNQVKTISSWSFANLTKVETVVIPKNILVVSADAFRGCASLRSLYVLNPECTINASSTQTLGVPGSTVIYGYNNSTAQTWAASNGYTFRVIEPCTDNSHVWYYTGQVAPTCTEQGYTLYTCRLCQQTRKTEQVAALGHSYEQGTCSLCGQRDPSLPDPCESYTDINRKSWYHNAADFVIARGYMGSTKTGELLFEPNTPCTRSMIVSVLYRLSGTPEVTASNPFTDVKNNFWYTNAILWAADNGVVAGDGKGHFMPNDIMTREQMAVVLKGYTEKILKKDVSEAADLGSFPDANKVTWSKAALQWAVAVGLVSGKTNSGTTILDPQGKATRAEVASVLMRFILNIATDA